ncbi:MAG: hypothetical protein K0U84_09960, partial [Actinomycetia bacterium]|nr:hypothetical protein [Actinomycetes bacterium]
SVDYPLVDIPSHTSGAPTMQIPQPPGWEDRQIDGVGFALSNPALTANHFSPSALVVLESEPSHWSSSAQSMFDEARSVLTKMGRGVDIQSITPTTVCGQPAEISNYTQTEEFVGAPISVKMLMAVASSDSLTYLVALTVATTEPDNPTYQRDSQAIVDGFVFLPSEPQ